MVLGENQIGLRVGDFDRILKLYHFQKADSEKLKKIYEKVQKKLRVPVYYDKVKEIPTQWEEDALGYGLVSTSLGQAWEEYEECLKAEGKYWEAYALSCMGMEILKKIYLWVERRWAKEGCFIGKYRFFGEQLPMDGIIWAFSKLQPDEIFYYKQSMLKPLASVCYLVNFQKAQQSFGICTSCSRVNCPNRERKIYGY